MPSQVVQPAFMLRANTKNAFIPTYRQLKDPKRLFERRKYHHRLPADVNSEYRKKKAGYIGSELSSRLGKGGAREEVPKKLCLERNAIGPSGARTNKYDKIHGSYRAFTGAPVRAL